MSKGNVTGRDPGAAGASGGLARGVSSASRIVAKQRIMPLSYGRVLTGGSAADETKFLAGIAGRLGAETKVIPVGRARSGIYLLAKFAVREGRTRFLMSPFTIPDVVTMVRLAGAEPVFFDFEPDSMASSLESIRRNIDSRTAAVMITHHHVNDWRLPEIAAICRENGAWLFDDCAIAFGGSIGGKPVGTLTDASVFSFSYFKLLNYFWGGLVTTRNPAIAEALQAMVADWPRMTARDYASPAKSCLKFDAASSPALFGSLVFPMIRKRLQKSGGAAGLEFIRVETETLNRSLTSRPSYAAFREWTPKLARIDEWLAHRRAIASVYRERLGDRMASAGAPADVIAESCFVNFPVVVAPERRDDIVRAMMLSGFDVGRSLYPNVHRHPKYTSVGGDSANVDRLVAGAIYLPTHFAVDAAYARAIADRLAAELD